LQKLRVLGLNIARRAIDITRRAIGMQRWTIDITHRAISYYPPYDLQYTPCDWLLPAG
jgi:hypothetical protein